jgi:hypothetical protein
MPFNRVQDLEKIACQLITDSQEVNPILERLGANKGFCIYDSLFVLPTGEVYGCEGVPYLYKNIYLIGDINA